MTFHTVHTFLLIIQPFSQKGCTPWHTRDKTFHAVNPFSVTHLEIFHVVTLLEKNHAADSLTVTLFARPGHQKLHAVIDLFLTNYYSAVSNGKSVHADYDLFLTFIDFAPSHIVVFHTVTDFGMSNTPGLKGDSGEFPEPHVASVNKKIEILSPLLYN